MALPSRTDQTWAAAPGTNDGALLGRNSTSKTGHYGTQPIVKPSLSTSTATTAQIVTALAALGLVTATA